jgi:hypothetical protein
VILFSLGAVPLVGTAFFRPNGMKGPGFLYSGQKNLARRFPVD